MVLADLGCGPSSFTIPMALKVGDAGIVYAVDSSPELLKRLTMNVEKSHLSEKVVMASSQDPTHRGRLKEDHDDEQV